jgi:GT2 family glycosyltransferase
VTAMVSRNTDDGRPPTGPLTAEQLSAGPLTVVGTTAQSHVIDVELTEPPTRIERDIDGIRADRALLLVRLHGQPIGLLRVLIPADGLSGETVLAQILTDLGPELALALGSAAAGALDASVLMTSATDFHRAHGQFLAQATACSVVVCTRDRADALTSCLQSLADQDHPDFTVWVIDNGPASGVTPPVVDSFRDRLNIHYVAEPVPGLSKARNTALRQQLSGEIVAWLDDDEIADSMWLSELTRALSDRPDAAGVSGIVLPAELATKAQVWFEQFGGHSKGRGFREEDFVDGVDGVEAVYPLPAFGVGANMAFRIAALRGVGGFDEALGAGTRTKGGEDTLMFTRLLQSGGTTLYRPTAVTRHFHRRDVDGLESQMYGYGTGLTAYYTALLMRRPLVLFKLFGLARRGLGDLHSTDSVRVATMEPDFPPEMLKANRRGMLGGPAKYARQRVSNALARRKLR